MGRRGGTGAPQATLRPASSPQIHLLIGNVQGAISHFKKAVQLNPKFPIAVVQKCYTDYR